MESKKCNTVKKTELSLWRVFLPYISKVRTDQFFVKLLEHSFFNNWKENSNSNVLFLQIKFPFKKSKFKYLESIYSLSMY